MAQAQAHCSAGLSNKIVLVLGPSCHSGRSLCRLIISALGHVGADQETLGSEQNRPRYAPVTYHVSLVLPHFGKGYK